MTRYYRKFVKEFAKIASPLYKLLEKEIKFNWNEDCNNAFTDLKKSITSYPVL